MKKYLLAGLIGMMVTSSWAMQAPQPQHHEHDSKDRETDMQYGTVIKTTEEQDREYSMPREREHNGGDREQKQVQNIT